MTLVSPPSALGFISEGKLQALAVGSDKRLGQLPDVPTSAEAGIARDTFVPTFFALAAPAGTPPAIIARLNAESRRAVTASDVAERLVKSGLVPTGGTPEAMTQTVTEDITRFGALVKAIGIKPE